jgi:hypothetical protein
MRLSFKYLKKNYPNPVIRTSNPNGLFNSLADGFTNAAIRCLDMQ